MANPTSTRIVVPGAHSMVSLLGSSDELLRLVERAFTCDIHVRGNEITISGEQAEVDLAAKLFEELLTLLERGDVLTADSVQRSLAMLRQQTAERPAAVLWLNILSRRGRTIRPQTLNQQRYVDSIAKHTIPLGIGPAATGTTYDIAVPVAAVGNVTADSLLEEVTGFVQVSPVPAAVPITNVQADAELVPLQIEGTKTFNFKAPVAPAAAPASTPAAPPAGQLPATGTDSTGPAAAGAMALSLALVAQVVRRRRRSRSGEHNSV